ncbi:venom metalloproteinase antarease-like TtrivMP_A isoform X2 [Rhipicephalus sanguineus]|uniref:venom metalloproteinase antarease-like TtrivMP_A isoform X2 n=1 Tax=Rhipicephalus sanguineus TaxID=34632 RepID=UPI00189336BE|nr:venom metalloproteinase antarease-like TtrivMP_A isoform X2 [Rhipicephalus sanguineus]
MSGNFYLPELTLVYSSFLMTPHRYQKRNAGIRLLGTDSVNTEWIARDMIALALFICIPLCSSARTEYFVYPAIVEPRSTASNLVLRINEDITLNLEKSDVLAEHLLFVTATRERHEVETVDTSSIQDKLYHDLNEQSSLMVNQTDGTLHVEGVVNSKLRIKPIPEGQRSLQGHVLHSLYEVKEIKEELVKMGAYSRYYPETKVPRATTTTATTTRRLMLEFVVEVHIISDEEHCQHFSSRMELIIYMGIMINAMRLRYLEMTAPIIKFKLVGVTMSKDDTFASVILGTLEAYETLDNLEKYYVQGNIPENPDVVYLMTGRDISSTKGGTLERGVAGLANVAGVCTVRRVALGEDVALSYEGVYAMAHEIAHLLGARHDPMVSDDCAWKYGYLLSYEEGGTNKYRLSRCSEASIRANLARLPYTCILQMTRVYISYVRNSGVMPGQKVSSARYCELIYRRYLRRNRIQTKAYAAMPTDLAEVCKMKCCYDRYYRTWCRTVDVLDGMTCVGERTCRRGVCANHTRAEK